MINSAQRHWQTYATLYDPDAPQPVVREPKGQPKPLAMKLGNAAYSTYRRRLLKRNPFCFYCGTEVDIDNSSLDHVIPECRGGKSTPGNLQLCCLTCNVSKADAVPVEWLADLNAKIEQLTKLAEKLAEVIDAEELASYAPSLPRKDGKKGKSGRPSGGIDTIPDWHIKRQALSDGKPQFHIFDKATGKPLIRGLKFQDAVHYLLAVGPDESIGLTSVTPLYHEGLGLTPVVYEEGDVAPCQ